MQCLKSHTLGLLMFDRASSSWKIQQEQCSLTSVRQYPLYISIGSGLEFYLGRGQGHFTYERALPMESLKSLLEICEGAPMTGHGGKDAKDSVFFV